MKEHKDIAGVGSWKLGHPAFIKGLGNRLQDTVNRIFRLPGQDTGCREEAARNDHYLRSHCAIYRTELLVKHNLSFSEHGDSMPAGKMIHRKLIECGYKMVFLPSDILDRYLCHLEHATMVLNPDLGARRRSISRGLNRIKRVLKDLNADTILNDPALDE